MRPTLLSKCYLCRHQSSGCNTHPTPWCPWGGVQPGGWQELPSGSSSKSHRSGAEEAVAGEGECVNNADRQQILGAVTMSQQQYREGETLLRGFLVQHTLLQYIQTHTPPLTLKHTIRARVVFLTVTVLPDMFTDELCHSSRL